MQTTTMALLDAAAAGNFERVRQLVQAGADLNALDDGEPLLDRVVSAFIPPIRYRRSPPTCCASSCSWVLIPTSRVMKA